MSVLSPLNELYQSLFSGIGQLPNVHYCGHYPNRMDAITVPAVLIDLVELEPGTDLGTEELVLVAHFEARVIMQSNVSPEPIQALVLSVLQWLVCRPLRLQPLFVIKRSWEVKVRPERCATLMAKKLE